MTAILLSEPVRVDGHHIRAVTLRMPSARKLMELSKVEDGIEAAIQIAAACSGLPTTVIGEFTADDLIRVAEAGTRFINARLAGKR